MADNIGYRKTYRLRTAVPGRKSIEVTFPYEVVEKYARDKNLTIPEFLEKYHAVAQYDGFDGVNYTFEEIEASDDRGELSPTG